MSNLKLGDGFRVNDVEEIKTPNGRLLARYLPEFNYTVTPRNAADVDRWIDAGTATLDGPQVRRGRRGRYDLRSPATRVTGSIGVKTPQR